MERYDNLTVEQYFLKVVEKNYEEYRRKWSVYFMDTYYQFTDDVLNDTILNCYSTIQRKGLSDTSEQGVMNYVFQALKLNIKREQEYAYNKKRDTSIIDISELLDINDNGDRQLIEKIKRQLFNEFFILKCFEIVEKNFDARTYYCFRLYYIYDKCTYKKLMEMTGIKNCKTLVNKAKKYLQDTLDKQVLHAEFEDMIENSLV